MRRTPARARRGAVGPDEGVGTRTEDEVDPVDPAGEPIARPGNSNSRTDARVSALRVPHDICGAGGDAECLRRVERRPHPRRDRVRVRPVDGGAGVASETGGSGEAWDVPSSLQRASIYNRETDERGTRGVRMNDTTVVLLIATKTVTLILGALITFLAYRAFRRQGEPALRALMVGFGLVTVGSAVGGALYHVGDVAFAVGVSIESLVTAAGFAVLVYSLYVSVDDDVDGARPGSVSTNAESRGRGVS